MTRGRVLSAALAILVALSWGSAPSWKVLAQTAQIVTGGFAIIPTGTVTTYVSTTGSDTANNCLNSGTPCLTINHALQSLAGYVYAGANVGIVSVADGTYPSVQCTWAWTSTAVITIQGDASHLTNVKIQADNNGYAVQVKDLCTLALTDLETIDSASTDAAGAIIIGATGNAGHVDATGVTFGALAGAGAVQVIVGSGGSFTQTGGNTMNGAAGAFQTIGPGSVDLSSQLLTLTSTPAFSLAFWVSTDGGELKATSSNFTGQTATGPKCLILGALSFNGTNPNTVLPGNSNCAVKFASPIPATANVTGLAPTGTTSTAAFKMMGLGSSCTITPLYSTRVKVSFTGAIENATSGDGATVAGYWGTGTPPANAAALTGTLFTGGPVLSSGTGFYPFSLSGVITGLTPGTAIWVDAPLEALTGGTATIANTSCDLEELTGG